MWLPTMLVISTLVIVLVVPVIVDLLRTAIGERRWGTALLVVLAVGIGVFLQWLASQLGAQPAPNLADGALAGLVGMAVGEVHRQLAGDD